MVWLGLGEGPHDKFRQLSLRSGLPCPPSGLLPPAFSTNILSKPPGHVHMCSGSRRCSGSWDRVPCKLAMTAITEADSTGKLN